MDVHSPNSFSAKCRYISWSPSLYKLFDIFFPNLNSILVVMVLLVFGWTSKAWVVLVNCRRQQVSGPYLSQNKESNVVSFSWLEMLFVTWLFSFLAIPKRSSLSLHLQVEKWCHKKIIHKLILFIMEYAGTILLVSQVFHLTWQGQITEQIIHTKRRGKYWSYNCGHVIKPAIYVNIVPLSFNKHFIHGLIQQREKYWACIC